MNTDMLNEARRDVSDVIEEVGALCTHIREAMDFADGGSLPPAVNCCDDALDDIDRAIEELHKIRDKVGKWCVWADGKEGA